jgi:hypothetical protein
LTIDAQEPLNIGHLTLQHRHVGNLTQLPGAHGGVLAGRAVAAFARSFQEMRLMMTDHAAILAEILGEADALIRLRLKERGLELPHLFVVATPDNQIVLRSNGDPDVLRSFGEDLKNVADELTPRASFLGCVTNAGPRCDP